MADNPGKCACTSGRSESASEGQVLESDIEPDSGRDSTPPDRSFQQSVSIALSRTVRPAPKGWNDSVTNKQLTFHDLNWKHLETEQEKAEQWKRLAKCDDTDEKVEEEEEEARAQRKLHKRQLVAE